MILKTSLHSALSSLVFVLLPAVMFAQRFAEALMCGIAIVMVTFGTLVLSYYIPPFRLRIMVILARCIIAAMFITLVQTVLIIIQPAIAERIGIFFPVLAFNIILLPHPLRYMKRHDAPLLMFQHAILFSLLYGVAIALFGLLCELLLFNELSFSITDRAARVTDSPFRLIMFVPGGMLLLGYIQGGIHYITRRKNL